MAFSSSPGNRTDRQSQYFPPGGGWVRTFLRRQLIVGSPDVAGIVDAVAHPGGLRGRWVVAVAVAVVVAAAVCKNSYFKLYNKFRTNIQSELMIINEAR